MKRAWLIFALIGILSGCEPRGQNPSAYRDWRDRVSATIDFPLFGLGTCDRASSDAKFEPDKTLTEICYKLTQPARWHGLWRNEFESSRFCPAPAENCDFDTPGDRIWLTIKKGLPQYDIQGRGGLYEVEFIGRRTLYPGMQGHMGMSKHELIVDRLISMKEIEAPPPQPSKAEVVKDWKECEAAKTCIPNWEEINKMKD